MHEQNNLNIPYGVVTGRIVNVTADNTDENRAPNTASAHGVEVVFKPSVKIVRNLADAVIYPVQPITARINENGFLTDDSGEPGVSLMATTGTDMEPSEWVWECKAGLAGWKPVVFTLAAGQTVDLVSLVDVGAQPNTVTVVDSVLADRVGVELAELKQLKERLTAVADTPAPAPPLVVEGLEELPARVSALESRLTQADTSIESLRATIDRVSLDLESVLEEYGSKPVVYEGRVEEVNDNNVSVSVDEPETVFRKMEKMFAAYLIDEKSGIREECYPPRFNHSRGLLTFSVKPRHPSRLSVGAIITIEASNM